MCGELAKIYKKNIYIYIYVSSHLFHLKTNNKIANHGRVCTMENDASK